MYSSYLRSDVLPIRSAAAIFDFILPHSSLADEPSQYLDLKCGIVYLSSCNRWRFTFGL